MRPFGFHLSIAGGVYNACLTAGKMGISAFQFFSRNPRGWKSRVIPDDDVIRFKKLYKECAIKTSVIHTNYLINLASPDNELHQRSIKVLGDELETGKVLGIDYIVTHLGSHRGVGREKGLKNVLIGINRVLDVKSVDAYPVVLLENSAGAGNLVGNKMDELRWVMERVENRDLLGLCIDSAHAFGSGYDVRVKDGMDRIFNELGDCGDRVMLLHLNDSKVELGSNKDRHEHLGMGYIGRDGLRNFLLYPDVAELPVIMETPRDDRATDGDNLKVFLELIG
ncbi:MAG: hypothetical protein B6D57_03920 [Candidatus Coatesbacteria bacterium 4484_99]|uniref:Probable endonuclease 4 n=1 Tax=Candidatus Coatesbacteria bacterium 4484_99 TaxID=1970774 RepID=A0A1W9S0C1_9BACT|nr:MAG: hypothetical protein B6D57_03920 [Candidatus Coatesbacteria bacterium 4484_99]RLC45088.1 MAG: endonuclease [Candidatus Coatesbacteria bacterium]